MALTRLTTAVEAWWLQWRPGSIDGPAQGYTCLVSDLAVGDVLCGSRMTITALGPTGSATRSITATRVGTSYTFSLVSGSTVQILRAV